MISRAASPMACAPVEQAVTTAWFGPFELVADRHLAGHQVDDVAGNEERADAARAAFLQDDRVFGDAVDTANAGTDHHAGRHAIGFGLGLPAGIGERFVSGRDPIQDEVADLAQFLGLKKGFRAERAVAAITARDDVRDLARKILDLELGDPAGGAAAGKQLLPAMLDAHAER